MKIEDNISLQEAVKLGRKRGRFECKKCGIALSLSDPELCEEHIKSNKGCNECRNTLGFKGNWRK